MVLEDNMDKSMRELFATPSTSRRNLNATYLKSCTRTAIPEHGSINVKKISRKISNQLKEIGLLETDWKVYRVNALYDFSYKKLKSYEKLLTLQVKKDISKLEPNLQNEYQHIVTKIEHFPDMICSERDNTPVKITIEVVDGEGCLVSHFIGFLLSIERNIGFMEEERAAAKAVILPLFLLNYADDIFLESVKYFLEDNFSCYVGPLKFTTYDLIFMLFCFSSPAEGNRKVSTIINYKGGPCKEISSVTYAVDPETITEMWKEITAPFEEEVSEDVVYEFLSILEEKFYKRFSLNISYYELQSIRTSLAEIDENYIKVHESHKSYFVIRHLTHLAQELLQSK